MKDAVAYLRAKNEIDERLPEAAFHAYVRTLHQLYLLGAAVQLKRMGYRMTKVT